MRHANRIAVTLLALAMLLLGACGEDAGTGLEGETPNPAEEVPTEDLTQGAETVDELCADLSAAMNEIDELLAQTQMADSLEQVPDQVSENLGEAEEALGQLQERIDQNQEEGGQFSPVAQALSDVVQSVETLIDEAQQGNLGDASDAIESAGNALAEAQDAIADLNIDGCIDQAATTTTTAG